VNPTCRQIFLVATAVAALAAAACAPRPPETDDLREPNPSTLQLTRQLASRPAAPRPEPTSILFVGNSYSFEAPKAFGRLAARDGRKLRIEQVTHGGWTLAKHAENEETLRKIREGTWDVVVFQEQSRIPSLERARSDTMFPPLRKLAAEARAHGAVPVLYQTWGYRDGDSHRIGGDDFHAMTRRLREGYRAAAQDAGGLTVVPVGDAWEREISEGRGQELFMKDGSHPTSHGDQITAQTFYRTLFPETSAPGISNRKTATDASARRATPAAADSEMPDPPPASASAPSAGA
jgi:hypothetical protein